MSVKVMSMVFDRYPIGGGEFVLALALADHAHEDGTHIFPSIDQLAKKTRQSERTVQYQLRRMETAGWLILVNRGNGGRGMHNEYRIHPDWIKGAEIASFKKGANGNIKGATDDVKGANDDKKGCNGLHPHITVIEPSRTVIEPSSSDPDALPVPGIAEESIDPVLFEFPLNDKTMYGLRRSQIEQFVALYPSVDIDLQLRACLGWNIANEARRKTRRGILAHINTWLSEKQNKQGYQPAQAVRLPERQAKFDPVAHVNRNRIRGNP